MGLIGIPILITLLIRIQDVRAKILEKRSPKAIKDEIAAFEELLAREEKELAEQVDKRKTAIAKAIASVELVNSPNLSRVAEELGRLQFYTGSAMGRKLMQRTLAVLDPKSKSVDVEPVPGQILSTVLLPGYDESLQRQIALVTSLTSSPEYSKEPQ